MSKKDKENKENEETEEFDLDSVLDEYEIDQSVLEKLISSIGPPPSVAASMPERMPSDVLLEQREYGARILMTIPFGSSEKESVGFVSIMGEKENLPVLTLCVQKPTGGCVITTVVFPSSKDYCDFSERLYVDCANNFTDNGGVVH